MIVDSGATLSIATRGGISYPASRYQSPRLATLSTNSQSVFATKTLRSVTLQHSPYWPYYVSSFLAGSYLSFASNDSFFRSPRSFLRPTLYYFFFTSVLVLRSYIIRDEFFELLCVQLKLRPLENCILHMYIFSIFCIIKGSYKSGLATVIDRSCVRNEKATEFQ